MDFRRTIQIAHAAIPPNPYSRPRPPPKHPLQRHSSSTRRKKSRRRAISAGCAAAYSSLRIAASSPNRMARHFNSVSLATIITPLNPKIVRTTPNRIHLTKPSYDNHPQWKPMLCHRASSSGILSSLVGNDFSSPMVEVAGFAPASSSS